MSDFKKRFFIHLSITVGLIVVTGGVLWYFGGRIVEFSQDVSNSRKGIAERYTALASLAELRSEYNQKGKKYSEVLQGAIVARDEFIGAGIGEELQSLARRSNLIPTFILTDELSPEKSPDGIGSIGFRLDLRGDMASITQFLDNVTKFRYVLKFESATVTREVNQSHMDIRGRILLRASTYDQ